MLLGDCVVSAGFVRRSESKAVRTVHLMVYLKYLYQINRDDFIIKRGAPDVSFESCAEVHKYIKEDLKNAAGSLRG